ncbi:MAG: sulfurtransferase TusA family protein [Boseongicola sp. SB0675_bin_26]|nr:sulfurtransferase TusA family protein [Boseongicola sp. SB0675_bin_26]
MEFDEELDALGLLCPLPVLKAAKRLRAMAPGATLRLVVDDPAAAVDVPHFCKEQGHELLKSEERGGLQIYMIRRSGSDQES